MRNMKFVAFLDVLGFSSLLEQGDNAPIEKYFTTVINELEKLKTLSDKKNLESVLVSDSIVLAIPYKDPIVGLTQLLKAVSKLQFNLAINDVWLRGGITIGHLDFQKPKGHQVIVGPGLSRAFVLERQATWPRVIIDPRILGELEVTRVQLLKRINPDSPCEHIIFDGHPGYLPSVGQVNDALFVDYMAPLSGFQGDHESFKTVYRHLKRRLYLGQEHYEKYRWLADYIGSKTAGVGQPAEELFLSL